MEGRTPGRGKAFVAERAGEVFLLGEPDWGVGRGDDGVTATGGLAGAAAAGLLLQRLPVDHARALPAGEVAGGLRDFPVGHRHDGAAVYGPAGAVASQGSSWTPGPGWSPGTGSGSTRQSRTPAADEPGGRRGEPCDGLLRLAAFTHRGGGQGHQVVGPAIVFFHRDFGAAAGTDEVGPLVAREAAATAEAASITMGCRPQNVIGVKDQKGTVEVDLEGSLSHPR